jgi:UDP-N-acetylmuramoylalanine--D-glutamate ligase
MTAQGEKTAAGGQLTSISFGDVCILGLGITGKAVVRYLLAHPGLASSITIYDGSCSEDSRAFAASLPKGVEVHLGAAEVKGSYSLAVASPGIAPHTSLYTSLAASAEEVIGEPELAWRISPKRWIAVTGTNGKTTTTSLIAHLLNGCGFSAQAAGNIGRPCIEAIESRKPGDWIVAELSSYQLHSAHRLAPDVAVLLNITPDHASWHGCHDAYAKAKERLFASMGEHALAVIDTNTEPARAIAERLRQGHVRVVSLQDVRLPLADAAELPIKGPHNLANALAASAVAAELGADDASVAAALKSFVPLEHRFEAAGEAGGVAFINDSKATNTDAAIQAVGAFAGTGSAIALFGGHDKGTDLGDLVSACEDAVRVAVCYGACGERFAAAFSAAPGIRVKLAGHLADAFELAVALAEPGETVLLSPACASFDEFTGFEQRGAAFKAMAAAYVAAHSEAGS